MGIIWYNVKSKSSRNSFFYFIYHAVYYYDKPIDVCGLYNLSKLCIGRIYDKDS